MNKYSLRFLNELTEKNYQSQQDEMLYQTVKKIATFIILTMITMIITLSINNQIPECILAVMNGFIIMGGVYLFKKKPQYRRTIPLLFQFISLISSTAPWIKYFVVGMNESDFVLSDLCTLGSLTFNTVTNFKQNCVKHLYFIASRSVWHFLIGYSPYNVVYIVFSIILLYNDYYRIFMQRQYYLTSQEKKIQNNILDTFCKEKIMITQYGQENQKFQTILVNQSLKEMLGLSDANEILKIIQLKFKQESTQQAKKQKCLQTYLFEDYLSLKDHFPLLQETTTIKLEGKVNDIKINIDIMVQNFLEKIFIIRLERIPNCVSNNSAALYKSFFKSVLKAGESTKMTKIISQQVYKNIILSLRMNDEAKYTIKSQMIDIVKIFQNLEYHCIYKIKATQMLQSDPLLLSSLIYLIGKVCQYRFIYMENLDFKFTLTMLGKFRNIQLYKNRNFHLSTEKLTIKLNIDRILYREHEGLICVQLIMYQFQ